MKPTEPVADSRCRAGPGTADVRAAKSPARRTVVPCPAPRDRVRRPGSEAPRVPAREPRPGPESACDGRRTTPLESR